MVYRLLYDLPENYEYRVVFMHRDLKEVLASQKRMLEYFGKQGAKVGDEQLMELFKKELYRFNRWVTNKKNYSILNVHYRDMIISPYETCEVINGFLGGNLDTEKMARIVDPMLYRNKV
jgi:hypothetical protein